LKNRVAKKRGTEYLSIDLIPDPFLVLQPDGSIVDANKHCSALLGIEHALLIGRNFKDLNKLNKLWKKIDQAILNRKEAIVHVSYDNMDFEVCIFPFETGHEEYLLRINFKDISNFLRLERELLKRNKELIIINNLSNAFISSRNLDLVIADLMEKVLLITDFHTGWILLKENNRLTLKSSRGVSPGFQQMIEKGSLAALCAETMATGNPLNVLEASDIGKISCLREEGIVFLVILPLVSEKTPKGLFFLASRAVMDFNFDFASLLALVANHVSLIIGKIKLFQEARLLSITDGLTGLHNTRYFYRCLDLEIARSNRYDNPFSLMLFDIDNFKQLNDNYGHQAGDKVLRELANIFKSISRETDTLVRYGGEEFIIILPNTSEDETISLADRIRHAVEENTFIVDIKERVKITLSGGIASYPRNAGDAKALLNAADTALYAAKSAGKNVVYCYEGFNK
jgi:diguanylate cyclase (GGDEF)-like protein